MTDKIQELHPDDDTQGNLHVFGAAPKNESDDAEGKSADDD
jgi:hypothetical protein